MLKFLLLAMGWNIQLRLHKIILINDWQLLWHFHCLLCRPVNKKHDKGNKNFYGVLPYVVPEVLRGKEYTQASDIYSFGIIMYEVGIRIDSNFENRF